MLLTERHTIIPSNPDWNLIDELAFKCKNLKNVILYHISQHYKETGKLLKRKSLEKKLQQENQIDYRSLSAATAQHVFKMVYDEFSSFFKLHKMFKSGKLKDRPRKPKYLHKTTGRYTVCFTNQQCRIRNGYLLFGPIIGLKPIKTKIKGKLMAVRIVKRHLNYVVEIIYKKNRKLNKNLNKDKHISIDLGINNLMTITSDTGLCPYIINGRPLKSINQFFNKQLSKFKSELPFNGTYADKNGKVCPKQLKTSKKIEELYYKRQNRIDDYLHKASKKVIDLCVSNGIGTIAIGYNQYWKQEVDMGGINNQNFTNIPHRQLVDKIKYKADMVGIKVVEINEAYTSKCSALDLEPIKKHEQYVGQRIKRGVFKTSTGFRLNSDVNGSLNILRKVIGDGFIESIVTDSCTRLSAIKTINVS